MKRNFTVTLLVLLAAFSLSIAQSTLNVKFTVNMGMQYKLENFSPDSDLVVIRGNMNGWAGESWQADSVYFNEAMDTMLYAYTWTVGPDTLEWDSTVVYKFVIKHPNSDGWESVDNRSWTWDGTTMDVALDTVWFNDYPYADVQKTTVLFSVDMAVQIAVGNFNPDDAAQHVSVRGSFNSWGETEMSPYDDGDAQTQMYTATVTQFFGVPEDVSYKYFIKGPDGVDNWESPASTSGGNRSFTIDGSETDISGDGIVDKMLDPVFFNDETADDIFLTDQTITFHVDMKNAVDFNNNTRQFTPETDSVYVAGPFNSWLNDGNNDWSPLAEWKMADEDGDTVYTYTGTFPKGTSRNLKFKFGFIGPDIANMDNEAAGGNDHISRLDGEGPFDIYRTFGTIVTDDVVTDVADGEGAVVTRFELRQNYPNPFNPTTTISFTLDAPTEVSLVIYNMLGQKVKTLYSGHANTGTVTKVWDGTNEMGSKVASGIYFYQLKTDNRVVTKKMTLLK